MKTNSRGFAVVELLVALVICGGLLAVKTKFFSGDSKRAAQSTAATANLIKATDAPAAAAAASLTMIGQANAEAPASPARDFITQEVPLALSLLPTPDAQKLIEAERRKTAVMQGERDVALRLYASAAKGNTELIRERDEAIEQRRAVDLQLEQAAAAEKARTMQTIGLGVLAVLGVGAWIYLKAYSVSPDTLGKVVADVRAGANPISALNENLAPRLHARVRRAAKLATEPKDS